MNHKADSSKSMLCKFTYSHAKHWLCVHIIAIVRLICNTPAWPFERQLDSMRMRRVSSHDMNNCVLIHFKTQWRHWIYIHTAPDKQWLSNFRQCNACSLLELRQWHCFWHWKMNSCTNRKWFMFQRLHK